MTRTVKTVCHECHRDVLLIRMDGGAVVAADVEVCEVIPVEGGHAVREFARLLHAPRCDGYRHEARRAKLSEEMRAFNRRRGFGP